MKRAIAVAALLLCSAPALAERTWIQEVESDGPNAYRTYVDMKSVIVKEGVAYFNTGMAPVPRLPTNGFIYSAPMNCRQRTNSAGVYVPSPAVHEKDRREGKKISDSKLKWVRRFNKQLEMVCPANITSKNFEEALVWIKLD